MTFIISFLKRLIFIISVFILGACVNSATKYYNKGLKKQAIAENESAIEFYKLSLAKGGNKGKLNFLIAENYRLTNRISEAAPFYAEALKGKVKDDRAAYYYAQGLKSMGNYLEARVYFENYSKKGLNKVLAKQAGEEAKFLKNIHQLLYKETFYNVKNAGQYINTEGAEFSPVIGKDGEIIYSASNNQFTYKATGTGFTDIYIFKPDGALEGGSGVKKSFDEKINNNKTHEACPALAPDASFIIFARSNSGKKKGAINTDLFISELRDGEWTDPSVLQISDPRAWESCPALSPDGKTLYFASNRKGGKGGIDLYQATYSDSAGWGNVKNLGPKINTPGNEMFPYVRQDGKLFFASDGHPGLGSLDIFVALESSTLFDSTATEEGIINLGPPINTNADDFGIAYKDTKTGYFSSNRQGGIGDDDIYEFWLAPKPKRPVSNEVVAYINVLVVEESIKAPLLDSARISLLFESGDVFADTLADSAGKAFFEIDTNSIFSIKADKQGYFTNNMVFKTKGASYKEEIISQDLTKRYYSAKIELQKVEMGKEIVLRNIFYDYNKANIRTDAEPELQLLVEFMKKNSDVIIELGSHTDSRGDNDYNMRLSLSRAKSAAKYMVSTGIEVDRIKAVGYGETKHILEDAQTEEEHQKNRRTEFKIIGLRNK